jgi:hypothetical protein
LLTLNKVVVVVIASIVAVRLFLFILLLFGHRCFDLSLLNLFVLVAYPNPAIFLVLKHVFDEKLYSRRRCGVFFIL